MVIGPEEGEEQQTIINKEITKVNKRTINHYKKIFVLPPINKARVCLFTPSHPICKPDKDGNCPKGWAMNENGQCYPHYLNCPTGYWRADDDETGACVLIPRIPQPLNDTLGGNVTDGTGNVTDTDTIPQSNATDTTLPDIPLSNVTEPDVGGGGGANETIIPEPQIASLPFFVPSDSNLTESGGNGGDGDSSGEPNATEPAEFEPLIQCGEGERIAADGLSCEPIVVEYPVPPTECPEGEQLSSDALSS